MTETTTAPAGRAGSPASESPEITAPGTVLRILNGIRPEFDFTASTDFIEDGLLDSLDMITLVAELDGAFGISIAGIDIVPENFAGVERIESLVERYRRTP